MTLLPGFRENKTANHSILYSTNISIYFPKGGIRRPQAFAIIAPSHLPRSFLLCSLHRQLFSSKRSLADLAFGSPTDCSPVSPVQFLATSPAGRRTVCPSQFHFRRLTTALVVYG